MADRFSSFVVLAEMRTGSNFLEANLNALEGVSCLGEAFNPHFIGYPNRTEILGVSAEMRERDPDHLLDVIRDAPGVLAGFRYFHDHDPRVLSRLLGDPQVAKIILTRNPLDSYVSWKIAQATGQWKLTNVNRRKEARATFNPEEFAAHVEALQGFQIRVLNHLQRTGQTGFYIDYEDLQDLEVMNGLARWLGVPARLSALDDKLKRQNPAPTLEKVENPEEMLLALSGLDRFNLTRSPNFEPRRGPAVPGYLAGAEVPLLFMPLRNGLEGSISRWLAALDRVEADELIRGMNQKQLRQWRRHNPGHRSFSVVRHPMARAHAVFCSAILSTGPDSLPQIRTTLRRRFDLDIPEGAVDAGYSLARHRAAFAQFLSFLKANLAGQTSIRVDAGWASQAQVLSGFAELALPDHILRAEDLEPDLAALARRLGVADPAPMPQPLPDEPYSLAEVWDEGLEALCQSVYPRDYLSFGYGPWKKS